MLPSASLMDAGAKLGPRVEYELSEFGKTMEPIIPMMRDWGAEYRKTLPKARRLAA